MPEQNNGFDPVVGTFLGIYEVTYPGDGGEPTFRQIGKSMPIVEDGLPSTPSNALRWAAARRLQKSEELVKHINEKRGEGKGVSRYARRELGRLKEEHATLISEADYLDRMEASPRSFKR